MLANNGRTPTVRFGTFSLDVRSGELRNGPTRLKVPDQSVQILKALLERPGELVTRDELRARLWPPDTFVDFDAGLNAAVRRLRDALNDSADVPRFVETLPRRGYRFIAPVEGPATTAATPSQPAIAEIALPAGGVDAPRSRDPGPGAGRARLRDRLLLVGTVLAALGLALWVVRRTDQPVHSGPATPARPIPITSFPGLEIDPAISPFGDRVAFAWEGESGDNLDIYVRLADGGTVTPLTTDAAPDRAPAWSPDGQRLAFVRGTSTGSLILTIPASGGQAQPVVETRLGGTGLWANHHVSWAPDGQSLLFADRSGGSASAAVFSVSLVDGARQQLTWPQGTLSDSQPVVSPDGRYLAFLRRNANYPGGNVWVQRLEGLRPTGVVRQLTFDTVGHALDWAHDSASVIYDSVLAGHRGGLWRIALKGGNPSPVLPNVRASSPSVARDGTRVFYQSTLIDSNIWRVPGPQWPNDRRAADAPATSVITSTFGDTSPEYSPDGTRIAFVSHQSGNRAVWVARSDGSLQMALTSRDGAFDGSPRWSEDGRRIAFDSNRSGSWNIYTVASEGGRVIALTEDSSNNVRPSWSGDGQWIYFGSDRTGEWQIWKAPAAGGAAEPVTRSGGREAVESSDGRYLYYSKGPSVLGLWKVPVGGGDEQQITDRNVEAAWALTDSGIVILNRSAKPPTIDFLSFASGDIEPLTRLAPRTRLEQGNPSVSVSRDGRWILYVQYDHWGSDIEMLRGFR